MNTRPAPRSSPPPDPVSRWQGISRRDLATTAAVLVILILFLAPRPWDRGRSHPDRATFVQLDTVAEALENFRLDTGRYPTTEEGLEALIRAPAGLNDDWHGPYLASAAALKDPWGSELRYRRTGGNGLRFDLRSAGPDRLTATEDDFWTEAKPMTVADSR